MPFSYPAPDLQTEPIPESQKERKELAKKTFLPVDAQQRQEEESTPWNNGKEIEAERKQLERKF